MTNNNHPTEKRPIPRIPGVMFHSLSDSYLHVHRHAYTEDCLYISIRDDNPLHLFRQDSGVLMEFEEIERLIAVLKDMIQ